VERSVIICYPDSRLVRKSAVVWWVHGAKLVWEKVGPQDGTTWWHCQEGWENDWVKGVLNWVLNL